MKNRLRTLLSVFLPLTLGTLAVAIFLAAYLSRNKAVVTLVNDTGTDLLEGQLKISSQANGQETGPIPNGDSATLTFQNFSEGGYILWAKLKDGRTLLDTGGHVAKGTSYKDRLTVAAGGDSLKVESRQQGR
jgi:hypothetical protein